MKRKNRTVKVTGRINRIYSRKEARKWNVNRVQKRKSCHADCGVDSLLHMCLDTVIPVIIKFQSLIKAFTQLHSTFPFENVVENFRYSVNKFSNFIHILIDFSIKSISRQLKEKKKKNSCIFSKCQQWFYISFNERREKLKEMRISHTFFTRLTLLYSVMGDTHQLSNNEMD